MEQAIGVQWCNYNAILTLWESDLDNGVMMIRQLVEANTMCKITAAECSNSLNLSAIT